MPLDSPLPTMPLSPPEPIGNTHLSPRELEIQRHQNTIKQMRSDGYDDYLIDAYIQKYKSILDPEIPFATSEWLSRFITSDKKMLTVKEQVSLLAKQQDTVLIEGPTGTGKELLAKALHGDRKGRLIDINCAAIPENLIESELFGHVAGSFTGALKDKPGLFEVAETLFLDEVGELPLHLQAKLLRVLQERCIRRVGDSQMRAVKCRVVCATLRDIEGLVSERLFREDLFYRLNTFHLRLTPLKDRTDDITPIANYCAIESERLQKELHPSVHIYSWPRDTVLHATQLPGNVRSIQQIVRRYQVFGDKIPGV